MRVTPHFRFEEFACRDGTPAPPYSHGQLLELCHGWLEPLRRRYGPVVILSGYRTPEHNEAVGGAPHSFHVYEQGRKGVAADVVCRKGTPASWYAFLNRRGAHGLHQYPGHVHIDTRAGTARW